MSRPECDEGGLLGGTLGVSTKSDREEGPIRMLHAGLDLSRKRLDVCLLAEDGERVEVGVALPDAGGLAELVERVRKRFGPQPVRAAVESMNGARFVHDRLEAAGLGGRGRRCGEGEGAGATGV
jgi:hypothetical protein